MVDNYAGSGYNAHLAFFAKGGIIGDDGGSISAPFVGSYKFGGVVPADGLAYVHEGERITPADGDPADLFQVDVHVDDPTLRDLIRVEIRRRDRDSAAEFRAGVA
jgi:hypothetical protein